MKKYFLFACVIAVSVILGFSGCKDNTTEPPCNNMGKLCIENKMDSTVIVNIVQKKQQVTLQKDYMECFDLDGNMPYTISISGSGYTKPDTTLMILPCDNKLFVVTQ
jgi:hypothetical protein